MKSLCDFCYKPTTHLIEGIDDDAYDRWGCLYCPCLVLYNYWPARDYPFHASTEFRLFLTETRYYSLQLNWAAPRTLGKGDCAAFEIKRKYFPPSSRSGFFDEPVYRINDYPSITPRNAREKLITYLTFL